MTQWKRAVVSAVLVCLSGCGTDPTQGEARTLAAVAGKLSLYVSQIEMKKGSVSDTPVAALSVRDQSGTDGDYSKMLDFTPTATGLTAWMTLPVPSEADEASPATLDVHYMGWTKAKQAWAFAIYEPKRAKWVNLGDNASAADWAWSAFSFALPSPLSAYVDKGAIRIRYTTTSRLENSYLDFVRVSVGAKPSEAVTRLFGLTLDSIEGLNDIETALSRLARRPTSRIVFDEGMPASYYQTATTRIHNVSGVMGELLDSFAMKSISVADYTARTKEYLSALGSNVDIWEVGNEINGEWLGDKSATVAKLSAAYDVVKAANGKTEMTLYYNNDCYAEASHEMFRWAEENVPARMRSGLDYVLVSYYEDDCNNAQPQWQPVFDRLGALFPNAKIGFGEVGTKYAERKVEYMQRYYSLAIDHPRFIGGYFWWYGKQDLIPYTNRLWSVFNELGRGF